MIELSKRAVACKHWRWMSGMSTDGMTVVDADETGICVVRKGTTQHYWAPDLALPDLADPATLGCLLALVREAWGDKGIHTECTLEEDGQGGWVRDWVIISSSPLLWTINEPPYDTEAAAFVAALEAAP